MKDKIEKIDSEIDKIQSEIYAMTDNIRILMNQKQNLFSDYKYTIKTENKKILEIPTSLGFIKYYDSQSHYSLIEFTCNSWIEVIKYLYELDKKDFLTYYYVINDSKSDKIFKFNTDILKSYYIPIEDVIANEIYIAILDLPLEQSKQLVPYLEHDKHLAIQLLKGFYGDRIFVFEKIEALAKEMGINKEYITYFIETN